MGSPAPPVSQNHSRASPSCAMPSLAGNCGGTGRGASGSRAACATAMDMRPTVPADNATAAQPAPSTARLLIRTLTSSRSGIWVMVCLRQIACGAASCAATVVVQYNDDYIGDCPTSLPANRHLSEQA